MVMEDKDVIVNAKHVKDGRRDMYDNRYCFR